MTKIIWCLHVDYNKTNLIFDVVPLSRPMLCLLLHVGEEHCTAVSCHAVHKWFGTGTTTGNGKGGILTRSFSLVCALPENHPPLPLVLAFSSTNTFSTYLTYEMPFSSERATWCSALLSSGAMSTAHQKEAEVHPPTFEKFSTSLKSSMPSCWRKPKTFPGKSQPGSSKITAGFPGVRVTPLPLQYFVCCEWWPSWPQGWRAQGSHTRAGAQHPLRGHLFCSKPCLRAATHMTASGGGDFGAVEARLAMT